jgi:hypothetical protein
MASAEAPILMASVSTQICFSCMALKMEKPNRTFKCQIRWFFQLNGEILLLIAFLPIVIISLRCRFAFFLNLAMIVDVCALVVAAVQTGGSSLL